MKIVLWILRIALCAAFLASGIGKLIGDAQVVAVFEQIGFGQWFRYLTGVLEILGALWVIIPNFSVVGSGLLACVMAGAIATHIFLIGGNMVPAIVLFAVSAVLTYLQRDQLARLMGR